MRYNDENFDNTDDGIDRIWFEPGESRCWFARFTRWIIRIYGGK